jgi:arylsulfatase A-like enzyme
MRFTDAHTPTAVCTPTRYGLLTGRYWWRTQYSGVGSAIEKNRLTLPALLQQHGYATACIGKWHLGWTWPTKDGNRPQGEPSEYADADFTRPLEEGPTTRGLDSYFGTDVPNFPPYCYINDDRTVGLPSVPSTAEFNRPGPMLPGWQWENILPELTRRAVGVQSAQ